MINSQTIFDQVSRQFRAFYETLNVTHKIYYMFFTSGLLHWVNKSAFLVPSTIPLVLIGSHLTIDEKEWMKKYINRPTWFTDEMLTDNDMIEILLNTSDTDFGWIDIDCFILDPQVFLQMSTVAHDATLNCFWSFPCNHSKIKGLELLNTYLMFFNVKAYRDVNDHIKVRPHPYAYPGDKKEHSDVLFLERAHIPYLQKYYATNQYPKYGNIQFHSPAFFDSLLVYEIISMELGYRLVHKSEQNPDFYYSNKAIHIGAANRLNSLLLNKSTQLKNSRLRKLSILLFFLLKQMEPKGELPPVYHQMIENFKSWMPNCHISELRKELYDYLAPYDISSVTIETLLSS